MERMKDLTQQYIEQLENMVKDLREKKFKLEEENKKLSEENGQLKEQLDKAHIAYRAVRKVNRELMNGYV